MLIHVKVYSQECPTHKNQCVKSPMLVMTKILLEYKLKLCIKSNYNNPFQGFTLS